MSLLCKKHLFFAQAIVLQPLVLVKWGMGLTHNAGKHIGKRKESVYAWCCAVF